MALLEEDHAFEIADVVIDERRRRDRGLRRVRGGACSFARPPHPIRGPGEARRRTRTARGRRRLREARATTGGLATSSSGRSPCTLARVTADDHEATPLQGAGVGEDLSRGRRRRGPRRITRSARRRAGSRRRCERPRQQTSSGRVSRSRGSHRDAREQRGQASARRDIGRELRGVLRQPRCRRGDRRRVGRGADLALLRDQWSAVSSSSVEAVARSGSGRGEARRDRRGPVAPGRWPLLLTFAGHVGFGAREVALGNPSCAGRIGEGVERPDLDLRRSLVIQSTGATSSTARERARMRVDLVEGGRLLDPVTDALAGPSGWA